MNPVTNDKNPILSAQDNDLGEFRKLIPLKPRKRSSELLADFLKAMVEFPEQVDIEEGISVLPNQPKIVVLTIRCAKEDRGKIIGREGSMIGALRYLFGCIESSRRRQIRIELEDDYRASPVFRDARNK